MGFKYCGLGQNCGQGLRCVDLSRGPGNTSEMICIPNNGSRCAPGYYNGGNSCPTSNIKEGDACTSGSQCGNGNEMNCCNYTCTWKQCS